MKIIQEVILDVVEPGFDLCHALALNAEGNILQLRQAVVALGKLLAQHLRIFGTDIIETILLERNPNRLFKFAAVRCHIDE